MKKCSKCGQPLSHNKKSYYCIKCRDEYRKQHYKKYPWSRTYYAIRNRCLNHPRYRSIKHLITIGELRELWFRDKAYLMKQPSIHRIDRNGHYEVKNCKFVEKGENASGRFGRWARNYDACVRCNTTSVIHNARGLCMHCYLKKYDKRKGKRWTIRL